MVEISELICEIKADKEKFCILLQNFEPSIKKYTRLLYKDEKEEIRAEFTAALWEAVCNIQYCEDNGQVVKYLTTALRNKYFELYRKSRKYHDCMIEVEEKKLEERCAFDDSYENMITEDAMNWIENELTGKKRKIYELIFKKEYTTTEAASELHISRQYVHRIKKQLCGLIKEEVLGMKAD